jgi:O-antigen/teichoic acid export membrane protein
MIFKKITDQLVKSSLKVLILRVIGVLFFFILSLFFTNFYKTALVGKYDFVRSVLLIVGGISLLGTNQAIIYYSGVLVAKNSLGSLLKVYRKMLLFIFGASLFFFILINLLNTESINTFFEKKDASQLIYKVILSLGAFSLTMLNIDTLRALKRTIISELYRNLFRYLPFFLAAILLFFINQTQWLVETYLLGFVILAIGSTIQVLYFFKKNKDPDTEITFSYNNIFKKSFPMALSAVSYFLMQSIDIILLGKFIDFETVAYYSVAVKLATVTSLVLQSVNIIIAPKIAEIFDKKKYLEIKKLVKKSSRLIFLLSLPALLVLTIFTTWFLSFFGEDYVVAKTALWFLLLGQFFNILCGPVAIYMNMTGKQNKLQIILALGLITNLVLNWILIPMYGMVGAASATAISMILWNTLAVAYTYKTDKIKTFIS